MASMRCRVKNSTIGCDGNNRKKTMETPDRWIVINVTSTEENTTVCKVLAGWIGGYCGSDSWRISSRIKDVLIQGDGYVFTTESGKEYHCPIHSYGMTSYMCNVYDSFESQNTDNMFISIDQSFKEVVENHRKESREHK